MAFAVSDLRMQHRQVSTPTHTVGCPATKALLRYRIDFRALAVSGFLYRVTGSLGLADRRLDGITQFGGARFGLRLRRFVSWRWLRLPTRVGGQQDGYGYPGETNRIHGVDPMSWHGGILRPTTREGVWRRIVGGWMDKSHW